VKLFYYKTPSYPRDEGSIAFILFISYSYEPLSSDI
jgi:hypothetical protein